MPVTANNSAGPRTVLLAAPRSFCAGVERAIAIAIVEQLLDPPPKCGWSCICCSLTARQLNRSGCPTIST